MDRPEDRHLDSILADAQRLLHAGHVEGGLIRIPKAPPGTSLLLNKLINDFCGRWNEYNGKEDHADNEDEHLFHDLATATNTPALSFADVAAKAALRSEEHTSELQSLMRISYAVFCLKKKQQHNITY